MAITDLPGITYSRTGSATAWRKDGTLAVFAPNVPRITDAGVTIEGQRTNLFARWDPTAAQIATKIRCTDAVAPVVAPLAGRNWIALDNTVESAVCYQTGSNAASTTYSISVFVETADGSQPVAGTTTTSGDFGFVIAGDLVLSSATYRRVAGNVWLVLVTATTKAITTGTSAGIVRYSGQSTRPLKFSGFQLELGARASTPIITTGAAATVGADNLYLGGLTDVLAGAFSVVVDVSSVPIQTGLFPSYLTVSAGSAENWIAIYRANAGNVSMTVRSGGVQTGSGQAPTPGDAPVKVAIAASGASVRWAVNGLLGPLVTATTAPVGLNRVHPLGTPAGAPGGAVGRTTTLFPYAMSDADLVRLTQ